MYEFTNKQRLIELRSLQIRTLVMISNLVAMTKWIEDWFGSKYYSLLYKHRSCDEAEVFLDHLIKFLNIPPNARILDCGSGKGRHSIYLNKRGFDVTGLDISEPNIIESKIHETNKLAFFIHDLRNLFRINYYDIALSLFTSFGYFENDAENNKMIKSIACSIKKDGWLVLDFMNVAREVKILAPTEEREIDDINFKVTRSVKGKCIVKDIVISEEGSTYSFRENVKAYLRKDLESFFTRNGLEVVHLLGDYELTPFDENTSERLILIGRKK